MRAISAAVLLGAPLLRTPSPAHHDSAHADEILDRMAKVYGTATSYRDTGAVVTTFFESGGVRVETKPFSTRFVRPDRFWFHYQATNPYGSVTEGIISQQGGQLHIWGTLMGMSTPTSLAMGVGTLAGVSSGSSRTIAVLLLPDMPTGKRLSTITPVTRLDDAKLGTMDCYRIQSSTTSDRPLPDLAAMRTRTVGSPIPTTSQHIVDTTVVWIDKATYLVRQVELHTTFPAFRTEDVTSFDPVLNGPIADSLFVFPRRPGNPK